ncbi:MutS-like protein [Mucilaginibacter yixingensis]|uniref:MutS-like protein n=1 Tax=Mucilaginibacter yixingensis TaxID=1295612 RepID=A0A2T5JBT0_9SPHI|nr:DNA mismatch repair protein MutS [Mucilaginibacter yixingensis]PTQ99232.1 MutS-like protein [Mucilaginibacter yixingensis]
MENPIITNYNRQAEEARAEAAKFSRLINVYSFMRLGVFLLFAMSIYIALKWGGMGMLMSLAFILLLVFVWLMSRQSYFEEQRSYFNALATVNQNEVDSISNRKNLYDDGRQFADDKHPYTADLDIFGPYSLFQLTNRAATRPGLNRLADWFSAPSDREEITSRQQALKELATRNDWKLDFQARLLFAREISDGQMKGLMAYLATPLKIPAERFLSTYIRLAPILLTGAIVAACFVPLMVPVAVLIALFHFALNMYYGSYVTKADFVAGKLGQVLQQYAVLFKKVETANWASGECSRLSKQLADHQTSAKIRELGILVNRLSYSLIMIVGFVLNLFFLWALKQMLAIENWKRNNKESISTAFDLLGEFEALLSLAGLHINYPDWCFAQIAEGNGYTYRTKALAHPLIKETQRVSNDFDLNDAYRIDIITGSNMAGKSTFLRTIGINAVLALCGAPACAQELKLSVIRVVTYMRIKDSLNESTSTFKAELDRLQMLLGAVEQQNKVYFLIDEMLRGTNSVDKYLGSKAVIEQLIRKKGVGLVATHDLQLSELEKTYPDYVRNFYFDIQVTGDEMLFDYKIKQGACKTFNASLLLRRIGIEALG